MPFTLKEAGLLSPKLLRNEIVSDLDQSSRRQGEGVADTQEAFPLVQLDADRETYFREHGGVAPMQPTALDSESPVMELQDIEEDDVTISPYKAKVSPEKGANTKLNSVAEIRDLYQYASQRLRQNVTVTRDIVAWQGDENIDGMIGPDGVSPHPSLSDEHVITPGTAFSDHTNGTPQEHFQEAELLIDEDGSALDQTGPVTAYMSPSTLYDLKLNNDLSDRFTGVEVQGLTVDQVANILPFERIRKIRLQVPRMNDLGQPVDETGAVVNNPSDAAFDNVLEPYDAAADTQRRNIMISAPGEATAFMPWFLERLAEMANNAEPSGTWAVDDNAGIVTQTWTDHDPAISWLKVGQEIGLEVSRPQNIVLIQDI